MLRTPPPGHETDDDLALPDARAPCYAAVRLAPRDAPLSVPGAPGANARHGRAPDARENTGTLLPVSAQLWSRASVVVRNTIAWERGQRAVRAACDGDACGEQEIFVIDASPYGDQAGAHIARLLRDRDANVPVVDVFHVLLAADYYCMDDLARDVLHALQQAAAIMEGEEAVEVFALASWARSHPVASLRRAYALVVRRVWVVVRDMLDPAATSDGQCVHLATLLSGIHPRELQPGETVNSFSVVADAFARRDTLHRNRVVERVCRAAELGICSFHPADVRIVGTHAFCTSSFWSMLGTPTLVSFLRGYLNLLVRVRASVSPDDLSALCAAFHRAGDSDRYDNHDADAALSEALLTSQLESLRCLLSSTLSTRNLWDTTLLPVLSVAFRYDSEVVSDLYPLFAEAITRDETAACFLLRMSDAATSRLFETHVKFAGEALGFDVVASYFENRARRGYAVCQRLLSVTAERVPRKEMMQRLSRSETLPSVAWDQYLRLMEMLRRRMPSSPSPSSSSSLD